MDAREVFLNANGSKIIIKMYNGKEYSSDGSSTERADFDQAKLHLQVIYFIVKKSSSLIPAFFLL